MRIVLTPGLKEQLRTQVQKMSLEKRMVARALLRKTLDELASGEACNPIWYPDSAPAACSTGPVTVPPGRLCDPQPRGK